MNSVKIHFAKAPGFKQTANLVHKTYSIIKDQIKFKFNNTISLGKTISGPRTD